MIDVVTGKSQTEALPYWASVSKVWDFPVTTEQSRLLSYLLYGTKTKKQGKKAKASAAEVIA